ncbi:iron-sulfur assembly protein IscA-like 2, mitochondrial [Bombyx mandarina]|uniref:Iron-sulfur cluster assembly 2 homolog, mitochondrial n=2 Tax=Bombyx TaxID=7090 RepID=A0A8R2AL19_BOMMO|nr:iron-sulfur assembly protein IscA-like 2, mitochondrial [Bombyx mori]XP_028031343.1 iron-sulfur assembly protein IscA-like 2, mitochondrial [Bombyx mandarina]
MFLRFRNLHQLKKFVNVNTLNKRFSQEPATSVSSTDISISDNCVQKLKELCKENDTFLRLCVESGGCSGFQYKFNLDNVVDSDDRIFEKNGVKVVVDETSLEYIKGSTIDYHTELIRSAFRVQQNPNADIGCSCGASFSIKID